MKPKIDLDRCKGCNICVYMCPKAVYIKSKKLSDRGYFIPEVAAPEKCFNWGLKKGKKRCELCIFSCPDLAIDWEEED